jgi:hypothetical protein
MTDPIGAHPVAIGRRERTLRAEPAMTDRASSELRAQQWDAGSSPRARAATPLRKLRVVVYDGVRFMGMVVLGMLGVWLLVLLFG